MMKFEIFPNKDEKNQNVAKKVAEIVKYAVEVWSKYNGVNVDVKLAEARSVTPVTAEAAAAHAGDSASAAEEAGKKKKKKKESAAPASPLVGAKFEGTVDESAKAANEELAATLSADDVTSHLLLLVSAIASSSAAPNNANSDLSSDTKKIRAKIAEVVDLLASALVQSDLSSGKSMTAVFRFNKMLLGVTFLGPNEPDFTDILSFCLLRERVRGWGVREQVQLAPCLTRWFNTLQHDAKLAPLLRETAEPISLPLQLPPEYTTAALAEAKKKQQEEAAAKQKQAKEAKGGKKKEGKGGGGAAAAAADRPLISRLDFRVGKIVECVKHADADSLYVEQIDVGDETGPRTVISGLVKFVPLEEMKNRLVVVVCNLKPRNMKGIKSHGMVLCASNDAHDHVEILEPPADTPPGSRVLPANIEGDPDRVVDPQKKNNAWNPVVPELKVNGDCVACYASAELLTAQGGKIKSKTLKNVAIS